MVPISTSLLPVLSGAIVSGDKPQVRHISSMSMRMTLLIAIPASVGMSIFAEPICMLLLAGRPDVGEGAARLLQVLALAIAFSSTVYTTNAMLQSFGRTTRPVIDMAVGGVVKIALSYALAGIPEINVMGSAVSTVASYLVIVILNLIAVRESLPGMDSVLGMAMPLLFSAAVMGAASYGAYLGLIQFLSPRLALVPAIVIAVIVYALCAVLFRGVSYEDVCMLPKGETIARLLKVKKSSRPRHMMVKTTSTRPSKGGRHMRNI